MSRFLHLLQSRSKSDIDQCWIYCIKLGFIHFVSRYLPIDSGELKISLKNILDGICLEVQSFVIFDVEWVE